MRTIKKGATDQSVVIRIIDLTDGTPETAVEHNSSGIDLWYRREGAAKTSITEAALSALTDAHSDGGIEHIGDGYYRLDLPDAAFATGANGVAIGGTVTGMVVIGCYVHLTDYDPQDTVRLGLTALPNAAADAAGGLPISDAGGLDLDAQVVTKINAILVDTGTDGVVVNAAGLATDAVTEIRDAITGGAYALSTDANGRIRIVDGTGAGEINTNSGAIALVDLVTDITTKTGFRLSATGVDDIWDEATSGHVTSGTFGQALFPLRANTAQAGANGSITLDASASAVDDFYKNAIIVVTGGTGANQSRTISGYTGSSKVATITPNWGTNPSSDSVFVILPAGAVAGASAPTAAEVADAVWDEDATAHQTQGSFGQAIGDPGADTDTIWGLANTNLNATVGSRSSHSAADVWSSGTRTLSALGFTLGASDLASGTITAAKFAAGAIDAAAIAADAIGASELAADAVAEIRNAITGGAYALDTDANGRIRIVDGTAAGEVDTASGRVQLTEAQIDQIVDEVWDEDATGHQTQGTFGQAIGDPGSDSDSIWALVNTNLDAAISTRATPAQVNAEVVDALATDTYAEPSQGTPAATASLAAKINWLYAAWRNRKTQTDSELKLFGDDGSTVLAKSAVSESSGTLTIGEFATGP